MKKEVLSSHTSGVARISWCDDFALHFTVKIYIEEQYESYIIS